jgi:hypothetical protein
VPARILFGLTGTSLADIAAALVDTGTLSAHCAAAANTFVDFDHF